MFQSTLLAQSDSLADWRVSVETPLSFGPARMKSTGGISSAAHFISAHDEKASLIQYFGVQAFFKEKFFFGITNSQFTSSYQLEIGKRILQESTPGYYVQEQSKYVRAADVSNHYGNFRFHLWKAVFGPQFRFRKFNSIQPTIGLFVGSTKLPDGNFAIKNLAGNDFRFYDIQLERAKNKGYTLDLSYTRYNEKSHQAYIGVRLAYTHLKCQGYGVGNLYDQTQDLGFEEIHFSRTYNFYSLSFFIGFNLISNEML